MRTEVSARWVRTCAWPAPCARCRACARGGRVCVRMCARAGERVPSALSTSCCPRNSFSLLSSEVCPTEAPKTLSLCRSVVPAHTGCKGRCPSLPSLTRAQKDFPSHTSRDARGVSLRYSQGLKGCLRPTEIRGAHARGVRTRGGCARAGGAHARGRCAPWRAARRACPRGAPTAAAAPPPGCAGEGRYGLTRQGTCDISWLNLSTLPATAMYICDISWLNLSTLPASTIYILWYAIFHG